MVTFKQYLKEENLLGLRSKDNREIFEKYGFVFDSIKDQYIHPTLTAVYDVGLNSLVCDSDFVWYESNPINVIAAAIVYEKCKDLPDFTVNSWSCFCKLFDDNWTKINSSTLGIRVLLSDSLQFAMEFDITKSSLKNPEEFVVVGTNSGYAEVRLDTLLTKKLHTVLPPMERIHKMAVSYRDRRGFEPVLLNGELFDGKLDFNLDLDHYGSITLENCNFETLAIYSQYGTKRGKIDFKNCHIERLLFVPYSGFGGSTWSIASINSENTKVDSVHLRLGSTPVDKEWKWAIADAIPKEWLSDIKDYFDELSPRMTVFYSKKKRQEDEDEDSLPW